MKKSIVISTFLLLLSPAFSTLTFAATSTDYNTLKNALTNASTKYTLNGTTVTAKDSAGNKYDFAYAFPGNFSNDGGNARQLCTAEEVCFRYTGAIADYTGYPIGLIPVIGAPAQIPTQLKGNALILEIKKNDITAGSASLMHSWAESDTTLFDPIGAVRLFLKDNNLHTEKTNISISNFQSFQNPAGAQTEIVPAGFTVNVKYEIQSDTVPADTINAALGNGDFMNSFANSIANANYWAGAYGGFSLYDYNNEDIGDGGAIENSKDKNSPGVTTKIKLKKPLYAGDIFHYTIQAKDISVPVNCTTLQGTDGNNAAGYIGSAVSGGCRIHIHGYLMFSLDKDGKITYIPADDETAIANKGITTIWANNNKGASESNSFTFYGDVNITSPLDAALSSAIKTLASTVESGLQWTMKNINGMLNFSADSVLGGKTGGGVENAWLKIRNIALTLLILGLIIIAFANTLQIDIEQYGLNRMIPKIIISIVMTYASWIIMVFFFDFSAAIQAQAMGLLGGANGLDILGNLTITTPTTGDIVGKVGAILILLFLCVGVLICGFVLLFLLIVRIVVLSFLLVVAPLAFILNVMPFAASLSKQWWTEFWKWMFMGPMAMVIIAIGSVIASSAGLGTAQTLSDTTVTGDPGDGRSILIGLIIFAATLYMAATLPLQWGGSIMKQWSGIGKKFMGGAYERSGLKEFMSQRKATIANMSRTRGEKLRSKVAGDGKSTIRSYLAGNSAFNRTLAQAQAELAHDHVIEGLVKDNALDKLDDQELLKMQKNAGTGTDLEEAIYGVRMRNGWTDNSDGSPDQEIFNRLSKKSRSLVAAARVAGKGRDLLFGSDNASWIGHAVNDASKEEIQRWGTDETKLLVKAAGEGLTDRRLIAEMKRLETDRPDLATDDARMNAAIANITTADYNQIKEGKFDNSNIESYRRLKALGLTRSIEEGKMKRGYEQGGSAKSGYFAEAAKSNPGIFNAGALKEVRNQEAKKVGAPNTQTQNTLPGNNDDDSPRNFGEF